MTPLEFLAAVLPSPGHGFYCAAELSTTKKEHRYEEKLEDLIPAIEDWNGKDRDIYFALSTFEEAGSREAINARFIKALFIDMDGYASKKAAALALQNFLEKTGMDALGTPWIVGSGGGLHVYWPLSHELPVEMWKPVAENLKRLCKQEGLAIDMTVTADAARVLRFYAVYRALVRAKVSLFSMPSEASPVQRATTLRQYRSYANLAESYSSIPAPFLAITHGVSAVGKSHVAMRLVESLGAIRLRSDVERKRLFGDQQGTNQQLNSGIYNAQASVATYQRLHELAASVLHSGFPVVIDATYLKREQRDAASQVAQACAMPLLILDCRAPEAVIAQWLAQRTAEGKDPSDATLAVIKAQQASREALTADEIAHCKSIDTNDPTSLASLVTRIQQHLQGHRCGECLRR